MSSYHRFAFKLLGEFGVTMAVPAVLAAWVGQRWDAARGGGYLMTALCLTVAFVLTAAWIVRRAKQLKIEFEHLT